MKGFKSFSDEQLYAFAYTQRVFTEFIDNSKRFPIFFKNGAKGFDYGLDMTFVTRYGEKEFPSTIAYITNCNSFTGKNTTYVALELDKPERLRQFSEKTRHRILSILN